MPKTVAIVKNTGNFALLSAFCNASALFRHTVYILKCVRYELVVVILK